MESGNVPRPVLVIRWSWRNALEGAVLGVMLWTVAAEVSIQVIPILRFPKMVLAAMVVGAVVNCTNFRHWLRWVSVGLVAVLLAISFNPWMGVAVRSLEVRDELTACPAVVVLSSDIRKNGDLDGASQGRLLKGYEVVRQGLASELIITRLPPPRKSYLEAVRRQLRALDIEIPLIETGIVKNTHDEALEVSRLARERGWSKVILVSDPHHMRRARAVFNRAGVQVLCAPCLPREYDPQIVAHPGDRVRAFHDWVYEQVGYLYYRLRGWI